MSDKTEIKNKNLENIFKYYKAFVSKDLGTINELISDDILLIDWEIEVSGREEFLKTNQNLFASVGEISIISYSFFEGVPVFITSHIDSTATTYFCPIDITIGENNQIRVLDLISFDSSGKICGIIAYKQ